MSNIFIAFKLTFPETIFLFPIKKSVLTFLILKVIDARKFRKYMGILNAFKGTTCYIKGNFFFFL